VCRFAHAPRANVDIVVPVMKKPLGMFGALLVVVGLIALAYQGFTYTTRETVLDIGPIHATADVERTAALPPVVGIVAVIAGIALIVAGQRKGA
jgi:hypothetical protein